MLGKHLRPLERRIFERLTPKVAIHPNTVSLLTVPPAALSVYFLARSNFLAAGLLILLSLILDMMDGALARAGKRATPFGAYLDPMMDKLVEFCVYLGLFLAGFPLEAFLAFNGILLIGAAKAWAYTVVPGKNEDWPSIGERSERYLLLFLSFALAIAGLSFFGQHPVKLVLWLIIILVAIGTLQRMLFAKRLIENRKQ
ncbi:MAG: CDP-alcohol phosphatidyltransferase family protein [Nanoarchaeota archaeon]